MAMGRGKGSGLFADFQELGRVWTHPKALHISQMRRELKEIHHSDSEGSIADFLDDRSESELDEAPGVVNLDESDDDDKSGELILFLIDLFIFYSFEINETKYRL